MVQHKVKQKVSLPTGIAKRGRVKKAAGPKKGQKLQLKAKNAQRTGQTRLQGEVTKEINRTNEQLIKERADCSTSSGPQQKKKK